MQAHIIYYRWLETLGLVANVELKTFPSLRRERSCAFFARPKLVRSPISMNFWVFLSLKNAQECLLRGLNLPQGGELWTEILSQGLGSLFLIKVPTLSRGPPPLGHNIDRGIKNI